MKRLDITINKYTGDIEVEAEGYTGGSCIEAIELLQSLTGLKTISETNKEDTVHTVECLLART